MKLNILSDLHLSVGGMDRPRNDADVVVLAGDIARPREAAAWALGFDKPVLYVLGNHEFYGGSIDGTADELKRLCAGSHVHVLDDDEIVIDGVRFLGSTLWTDFRLFGDGEPSGACDGGRARNLCATSAASARAMRRATLFTPQDSAALFERHADWLDRRLDDPARRPDGGDHPPRAVAAEHPSAVCRLAVERLLRIGCGAPASGGTAPNCGSTATRTTASTTWCTARASSAIRAATRRTA